MPPVIIAVASAAAAGFTVTAAGTIAFSLTFSQFLIRAAVALVLGYVSSALSPKPKGGGSNFQAQAGGLTQTVRQPTSTHKLIFGETRVGGTLVYIGMTEDNKFLHLVIAFAPHEIDGFDETWINDYAIPNDWLDADGNVNQGTFENLIRIRWQNGTDGQTADAVMVSALPGWTSAHRLQGIAYKYCRLEWDQDKFPGGVPNITTFMRGYKIFDVRDSATRFTTNACLFQYKYFADDIYGVNAEDDIDNDTLAASANIADEIIDTTETDYTATNADSNTNIITLAGDMLDIMRGDRVEVSSSGALPIGLSAATSYYWMPYQWKGTPRGRLAASLTDAMAGVPVNFTSGMTRTNLINYSEQFDNALWTKSNLTVTANATTAPDATATADSLSDASGAETGYVSQPQPINDTSELVTYSCYFKKNTSNYLEMEIALSGGGTPITRNLFVDLTNKAITGGTNDGQGIADVGGGWMRAYVQALNNGSGNTTATVKISAATNSTALAAANTGAVYAWGAQLEQWPTASTYIATTSGSGSVASNLVVTRTGEPRYHGSGILDSANALKDNINDLLSASAGRAIWTAGKWLIKAGAYETPTVTLTMDDIVDSITTRTMLQAKDKFNTVKGLYRSPFNFENPSDYPVLASQGFIDIDGEERVREMDFPFSPRPQTCRRIGKIELFKARQEIAVRTSFNLKAIQVRCGDVIMLDIPRYGWNSKHFEVTGWTLVPKTDKAGNPLLAVQMDLRETDPSIFDWTISEEQTADPAPNSTLPDAFNVNAVTGLRFDSFPVLTLQGDTLFRIVLGWDAHPDSFVTRGGNFEIQYKLSTEANFKPSFFVAGDLTTSEIVQGSLNVEYDIRIRAVNNIGVRSGWQSILGVIAGSSGGVTESRDYGTPWGSVGSSQDYGAFVGDAVGSSEDWGQFVL